MKSFVRWMLAFCFLLGTTESIFTQSRNTDEIRGSVTDATGAAITGTTVTLTNTETDEVKTFTTNSQAGWRIASRFQHVEKSHRGEHHETA